MSQLNNSISVAGVRMPPCCQQEESPSEYLKRIIGGKKTKQLFAASYDVHLNPKDTVILYGKLFQIILDVKEIPRMFYHTDKFISLRENILEFIKIIRSAVSPNSSNFAAMLEKAMESLGAFFFQDYCQLHFYDAVKCMNKYLLEPVRIMEENILQQLNDAVHEADNTDLLTDLVTFCPIVDFRSLTNDNLQSVLHVICMIGEDDIELISSCLKEYAFEPLQVLLNEQRHDDGNTALHLASKNGKSSLVQYLIGQGAQTSLKNCIGQSPFDISANDGIRNIIKKANLFDSLEPTQLFTSLLKKSHFLKDKLLDIEKLESDVVVLNYAINCGNVTLVEEILTRNKSCAKMKNAFGVPFLVKAIGLGNAEIVRNLLQNGADFSAFYCGMNALHIAVQKGDVQVINVLLNHVCDLNVRCKTTGHTALHLAAKNGNFHIVNLLLRRGANYELRNKTGQIPYDVSKNRDVSDLLNSLTDLHEILEKDDCGREECVVDIFWRAEQWNNFDVLWKAKNEYGMTAAELIMERKGPVYYLLKQLFLSSPMPLHAARDTDA